MTPDIILSIAFIIASLIPAYAIGCFNLKIINYYTIVFWFPVLFCIIGAFIIRSGIIDNSYFIYPIKEQDDSKKLALLLTTASFSIMIFTIWIIEITFKKYKKINISWMFYTLGDISSSKKTVTFSLWILTAIFFSYYIYSITPSPLYLALNGSSATEIAIRRIEVTRDYTGIGYFKTLALTLPFILTYYSICEFFNKKGPILPLIISIVISIITTLLNGEKAPLLFYFIGVIITISYLKPLKLRNTIFLLIITTVCTLSLYIVFFDSSNFLYLLYIIVERLFIAQESAMFYATTYYANHDYIGLSSMNNIITKILLIEPSPRASEIFMSEYLPNMVDNGGWNVNGYFAHEAYSNFGILGVIFGSIYAGIINALTCIFFRYSKKSSLSISFFAFYSISITTVLTSFNYMLFNTQLILLFFIYLTLITINRRFN
ncbi:O-antigen polymerase [Morganella morganii]|uniref:O-antigen polymerase n=1 Tax=Morganella morganii TaxID=582 RepID=UPI0034E37A40